MTEMNFVATNLPPWSWRKADAADSRPLAELINGAYRGDSGRLGWTTEADLLDGQRVDEEMLEEMFALGKRQLLVAVEPKSAQIVGCVAVEIESAPCAALGLLTVAVDRQKLGLGDFLLRTAEIFARTELGATQMTMHVISLRSELIAWYERRGYKRTGAEADFPYGNERFGVPLRGDLRFAVLAKTL